MNKRILWLSNNTIQREYEVPTLIKEGFEVYCPKVCGYGLGESYLSISRDYDYSLTLDRETIDQLDITDLYAELSKQTLDSINSNFDVVFIPPMAEVLRRFIHHYKGIIVLRWIGDEEGLTCTERLIHDGGYSLLYQINRLKERFYFAYSFSWEIKDECDMLRGRGLYMPLPLVNYEDTKRDGDKDGLLICSNVSLEEENNIKFHEYYNMLKTSFKVIGEQLVPPENYNRLFIGNDFADMREAIAGCTVAIDSGSASTMNTEYWLQIVANQKPLIYTKESKAVYLLGENSPGYCRDKKEAVIKFQKIIRKSRRLSEQVINYQNGKLKEYTKEKCLVFWKNALKRIAIDDELRMNRPVRKRKICVILPIFYLGGVLSFTLRFVTILFNEIKKHGSPIELVFAHVDSDYYKNNGSFAKIRDLGVAIREISLKEIDKDNSEKMLEMAGFLPTKWHGPKQIPEGVAYDDGIHMLMDCDYLINMTDRSGADVQTLPVYPYAVVAHDYIQRYSPFSRDLDLVFIPMARNADKVFVTSEPTYNDALQYAMVKQDNLVILPILFEMLGERGEWKENDEIEEASYFLWSTNCSKHKNHMNALRALDLYYRQSGNLKCHITGALSHLMNPKTRLEEYASDKELFTYMEPIQKFISNHPKLQKNLIFDKYLGEEDFRKIIKNARFVFHPGFADNGNGTAIDAASFGVPTLSNDYPAMRYISDKLEINCQFVRLSNTKETASALLWMQENYDMCANSLDYDRIDCHSFQNVGSELFDKLNSAIGFEVEVKQ